MGPRVVVLVGPTASGKTDVGMRLYDALGGASGARLISVDSALVYKGMDIGTAKPSATELSHYPHALIDIRDPVDPYTVAEFVQDADREVTAALAAGVIPILVGGTMLYARRFVDGIAKLPQADQRMRQTLEDELKTRGPDALYADLLELDPDAAADIHPNNPQRLLRALEVIRLTGMPLSTLWQKRAGADAEQRHGVKPQVFGIVPTDRGALHERILHRFEHMLAAGFLAEVATLRSRGDLHLDLPAMRAVGYRQAWQYLANELEESQFVANALTATRRLAKRQLTWMRQWLILKSLDMDEPHRLSEQIFTEVVKT